MKEDVLEQIVDDYLKHRGYFTRHNVRFKPANTHLDYVSNQDSVDSDIDVIAVDPRRDGADKVLVLSCKAWQSGFDPISKMKEIREDKKSSGREAWRGFRELCKPKWSEAFVNAVEEATGTRCFTYYTVVTALKNSSHRAVWEENVEFRAAIDGNEIRILTLSEMLDEMWRALTETTAPSEIGRAIQLMKAARWTPPTVVKSTRVLSRGIQPL